MPISSLTGTTEQRTDEIQNYYINFEPATDDRYYQYPLYTVPIGQTFGAKMSIISGSVSEISGAIVVEKIVHIYESETEAANFINSIGESNISSIIRRPFLRADGSSYMKTEIQIINYPKIDLSIELLNSEIQRGFKVEVFSSGSNGLREIDDRPVFNVRGDLISDTYLKYFEVIPK